MKKEEFKNSFGVRLVAFIVSAINFIATIVSLLTTDTSLLFARIKLIFHFAQSYSQIWPPYLILSTLLLMITSYEYEEKRIPHSITIPGTILGVSLAAFFQHITFLNAVNGAVSGILCFGLVYYLTKGRSLGFGVVMMEGMIGAFVGPINLLLVNIVAFVLTILYVVYHRVQYKNLLKRVEFGPLLAIATGLVLLFPIIGSLIQII